MTSVKQIDANRANAKRSTGPRSEEGKARSSKNALKHGLNSRSIVIWDEEYEQFELLRAGLEADFRPMSTIDRELVDRLAGLLWRLRRIPRLDAALLDPIREEEPNYGLLSPVSLVSKETREKIQKTMELRSIVR